MGEDPRPRRIPGGALPRGLARPRQPETNGHNRATPTGPATPPQPDASDARRRHLGVSWQQLDEEDEQQREHERVAFRRVADVVPSAGVKSDGRPSTAVIAGVLIVLALVVLAVALYRMAPP
jgi:hypothetical protein